MSNVSKLNAIVRIVSSSKEVEPDENLIIFDRKNQVVLNKVPTFSIINKPLLFSVSTTNIVRCDGIKFQLPSTVSLGVKFHTSCPYGNEGKVVKALYRDKTSLEEVLNHKVKSWLVSYLSEKSEESIFNDRDQLSVFLVNKCIDQVGLKIVPKITFQNEDKIDSIDIDSQSMEVRVSDYKKGVQLTYKTNLKIIDKYVIKAYTTFDKIDRLKNEIKRTIDDHFLYSVNLHDFCFQLDSLVADELKLKIDRKIEKYGRKLSYLELDSPTIGNLIPLDNPLKIEQPVNNCILSDFKDGINVESILILELTDIAKLVKSGFNNFPVEVRESVLPKLIQSVLFNKTYRDVILDLKNVKKEIEFEIESEMNSYGYVVKQHTFIPNLHQIKLNSDGFDLQLKKEEFTTSDTRVPINLQVDISGVISSLDQLPDNMLLPNSDIEKDIITSVRKLIRTQINRIDPQIAYTQYSYNPTGESVQQELEVSVSKVLIEKFKADSQSLRISIRLAQSEITEKVSSLTSTTNVYETNILSKRGQKQKYNESIIFQFRYKILGVSDSGWAAFQQRAAVSPVNEIEELSVLLEEKSRSILESVPYSHLVSGDTNTRQQLHKLVQENVLNDIGIGFGLNLKLISINRSNTHSESLAENSYKAGIELVEDNAVKVKVLETSNITSSLEKLYEKLQELLEADEYEDALEVEKQIKELKKRSSTSKLDEGIESMNSNWLGEPESDFNFDDFIKPDTTKRLSGGNNEDIDK